MSTPTIIRLSITPQVRQALTVAKKKYPTLSDPELLKLALSKMVTENDTFERGDISLMASHAVGQDYLEDADEDIYSASDGVRVQFD